VSFSVKFWGVRGSIACPSPRHIEFGGNTSCLEVMAGDRRIIFDAGTGIRELGKLYMETGVRQADILLTHTHWDHINGFPFFKPAFAEDSRFRIFAGHLSDHSNVRAVLAGQMMRPMFPVPLETMSGDLAFEDFRAGDSFELGGGVRVRTASLNHPDSATGYRLDYNGKSLCYVTDTEHVIGAPDQNVLGLIQGADLVIYDCTYTDDEFPAKIGWGHSTWQEGIRLCRQAEARRLVIFHHEPDHDDTFMKDIEAKARRMWSETVVAREGMRLSLD
jgi:phosphoribosyl 1,2-cyclic phosphodiesterase